MDGAQAPAKVKTAIDNGVGIITLYDPGTLNAAGMELMADLNAAFQAFAYDDSVRAIVITGEGRGFCSGANLSGGGGAARPATNQGPNQSLLQIYNPFVTSLRRSPKPLVAAVNGVAAGVGVSLALACDLCVAAESSYFLLAFRRIGLVPDGGATWLLPRLIGWGRAAELSLLADRLPAEKAKEWGLVNFVFDDAELFTESMKVARRLANGPRSLALIRKLYWASPSNSYEQQLDLEAQMQSVAGRSKDNREGVAAFLEKRDARFTGE